MKNLIIIILLSLSLCSQESVRIPEDICIKHLKKVVKHGWNDSNATVNAFIIKSGSRAIPRILKQLHKPLSTKDGYLPVDNHRTPKLLLNRDDYTQLFSYVKYLEYQGKQEEAYTIYIDTLKGINHTDSRVFLSMMFHMSFEKIILTSLKESLTHNRFSEKMKSKLKKELKNLLLLNKSLLLETIEYDNLIVSAYAKEIQLKKPINQEEKLMQESSVYGETYMHKYNVRLTNAIKTDSLEHFILNRKKERDEFDSFSSQSSFIWNGIVMKIHDIFSLEHNNTKLAQQIAKAETLVSTPSIYDTYRDYLSQVENNKEFLERL